MKQPCLAPPCPTHELVSLLLALKTSSNRRVSIFSTAKHSPSLWDFNTRNEVYKQKKSVSRSEMLTNSVLLNRNSMPNVSTCLVQINKSPLLKKIRKTPSSLKTNQVITNSLHYYKCSILKLTL